MVTHQLALVKETPAALMARAHATARTISLPKSEIDWRVAPGRWEPGPKGLKLAVIEVEMPRWLAKDRGLE